MINNNQLPKVMYVADLGKSRTKLYYQCCS